MSNVKLYCSICNKFVGERTEMVMKIKKGTYIEIICTCLECTKKKHDVPDFMKTLFSGFKK